MPKKTDSIVIESSLLSERLDRYLAQQFPEVSRSAFQRMIVECDVKVNGLPTKPTHAPTMGDVIEIVWPKATSTEMLPQDIPLEILFEDADMLVINKSAEMVVHPSAGHEDGTVVNAVLHHCRGSLSGVGGVQRPGIVHRLDLGTSGCLVVAKNDKTHLKLTELFAERVVEKNYQAIVCGALTPEGGDIRTGLARHPTQRKRMAVVPATTGRFAWTSFRLQERLRATTFVEVQIHTGRTHQIRAHFQHIGFPVLGDDVYGKRQSAKVADETGYTAPRQMLHARKLSFKHPRTRRIMEFNAPLPADFKTALSVLRGEAAT